MTTEHTATSTRVDALVMPLLFRPDSNENTVFPATVEIPMSCQSQAVINHSQSLMTLKRRGGLSPEEAIAIRRMRRFEGLPREQQTDWFIRFGWGLK